ncbi:MAG: hypothetical protein U9N61_09685 [Euryarchaeota archaeon]|nr:hypothetical protein [Euryarchaeota archaeon]
MVDRGMSHPIVPRDAVSNKQCVLLMIGLNNDVTVRSDNDTVAAIVPLI